MSCGVAPIAFREWELSCKATFASKIKVFEVGGGSDKTPPELAELTMSQTTTERVELKFEGFMDEAPTSLLITDY